jgi:hypothetical protein
MKIIIESTEKITSLNGVPARIWEGYTQSGIKIHCFIARVAVSEDEKDIEQFEKELKECKVPSPEIEAYPARLIL